MKLNYISRTNAIATGGKPHENSSSIGKGVLEELVFSLLKGALQFLYISLHILLPHLSELFLEELKVHVFIIPLLNNYTIT